MSMSYRINIPPIVHTQEHGIVTLFSHRAEIETERLLLRSVEDTPQDHEHCTQLFTHPAVMERYEDGHPSSRHEIVQRINGLWAKRWEQGDFFSAFMVFEKDSRSFVGHIRLSHGKHPGQASVTCLLLPEYWNKGLGTEATASIVHAYAPVLIAHGHLIQGKPLQEISAITREDNPAAQRMLEKVGLQATEKNIHFSIPSITYVKPINHHPKI